MGEGAKSWQFHVDEDDDDKNENDYDQWALIQAMPSPRQNPPFGCFYKQLLRFANTKRMGGGGVSGPKDKLDSDGQLHLTIPYMR